jgi:hypothetical protein
MTEQKAVPPKFLSFGLITTFTRTGSDLAYVEIRFLK